MTHPKRRAISYIIGKLISGKNSSSIYDYNQSSYFNYSGTVSDRVNIYDYSRSCYLTGTLASIYDYGTGQYISLKITGNRFSGYDYGSGTYYNGAVNGNSISFYDYEGACYYNFSI